MRRAWWAALIAVVLCAAGCGRKMSGDELIAALRESGCEVEAQSRIQHSRVGADTAFWMSIDGNRVSAWRFSSAGKAAIQGRAFRQGMSVGYWAFEFVDPKTAEKIKLALR